MIGIIDYGLGNIEAFRVAYKRLNIAAKRIVKPEDFQDVTHIILPGVGAFDLAMSRFIKSNLGPALEQAVCVEKKPVLGICVGMQILANSSEEGTIPGLNLIPGVVRRFEDGQHGRMIRCPHMGWNDISPIGESKLFSDFEENERFYFLHSYYFEAAEKETEIASAKYGSTFCCSVGKDNVFGVQFHPEKSHDAGLKLLNNFWKI